MRARAKNVLVGCILEHTRRAAVEKNGEFLQFFGDWGDGETVTARDITDHEIDLLPVD